MNLYLINGKHNANNLPDLGPRDSWEYRCQRPLCGYHWTPKNKGKTPVECPSCKSRSWKLPAGPVEVVKDDLLYCLEQIIGDLPEKRDWLDPMLEELARMAIKKARKR